MKQNTNVIKQKGDNSRIYCHEDYAQEMYDIMFGLNPKSKDITGGELFRVTNFRIRENGEIEAVCENLVSLFFLLSKEKKYLEMLNMDETAFTNWILSDSHIEYLKNHKIFILVENAINRRGSLYSAHLTTIVTEFREQIGNPTSAYVAKIVSKNQGGFIVEVQGIKAFLPGSLAAANKISNFESFIGKDVYVMVEDFLQPSGIFVVSHKKYLDNILPGKLADLERNQRLSGIITGTSKFGIFIEIDEIFTGLLHIAEMDTDTSVNFTEGKFKAGQTMDVWLKDIKDNKLILTLIDPSIRQNEMEQLRENVEGEMKDATIVAIKPHGALMEIEKDMLGLLPVKEMKKTGKRLVIGETFPVFVKKVDSSAGKIYLTLSEESAVIEK